MDNIVGLAICANWTCSNRITNRYYTTTLVNLDDVGNINGERKKFCSEHCLSEYFCPEDDAA